MTVQNGQSSYEYIYGVNPVIEALRADRVLEIFLSEKRKKGLQRILDISSKKGISVRIVEEDFFSTFPKGHQSIAARVKRKRLLDTASLLKEIGSKEEALIIILDEIEDPRNVGAIIRVAEASGTDGLIIQRHRQAGITPAVIKASAGAFEFVRIAEENNIKYGIRLLKDEGFRIIAAEATAKTFLWDVELKGRIGLVVGSESKGIRETVLRLCDEIVRIPMVGRINSLNVSVATGVLVFEILRQRLKGKR